MQKKIQIINHLNPPILFPSSFLFGPLKRKLYSPVYMEIDTHVVVSEASHWYRERERVFICDVFFFRVLHEFKGCTCIGCSYDLFSGVKYFVFFHSIAWIYCHYLLNHLSPILNPRIFPLSISGDTGMSQMSLVRVLKYLWNSKTLPVF